MYYENYRYYIYTPEVLINSLCKMWESPPHLEPSMAVHIPSQH